MLLQPYFCSIDVNVSITSEVYLDVSLSGGGSTIKNLLKKKALTYIGHRTFYSVYMVNNKYIRYGVWCIGCWDYLQVYTLQNLSL